MKKIVISFWVFLLTASFVFAQNIQVLNDTKMMSQGKFNAYIVELPETNQQAMEKAWISFMKNYKGKTKFNRRTKEVLSDNMKLQSISENTVDVYAVAAPLEISTQLTVWFDLGGAYASSENEKADYAARTLVYEFAVEHYRSIVKNELGEHEKLLKNQEQDLKQLERQEKDSLDKIEYLKKEILRHEGLIAKAKEEQEKKKAEIQKQKENVQFVKEKLSGIK